MLAGTTVIISSPPHTLLRIVGIHSLKLRRIIPTHKRTSPSTQLDPLLDNQSYSHNSKTTLSITHLFTINPRTEVRKRNLVKQSKDLLMDHSNQATLLKEQKGHPANRAHGLNIHKDETWRGLMRFVRVSHPRMISSNV